MKDVVIPRRLAEQACGQLAAVRSTVAQPRATGKPGTQVSRLSDWDSSSLGKLFSLLTQEFSGRRAVPLSSDATAAAKSNRKTIAKRFRR